jgi:hypothetical protein
MDIYPVFYLQPSALENEMFFCSSLKVFYSKIGISLHIKIYKFHVSDLSQLLHHYI